MKPRALPVLTALLFLPFSAAAADLTRDGLQTALADALTANVAAERIEATLTGDYPEILYRHDASFAPEIEFTRLDQNTQRFTAAVTLKDAETQTALGQPFTVEGRYESWVNLPMLRERLTDKNIIRDSDIVWQEVPSMRVKRDVILDATELVGLSPKRVVAAYRPVERTMLIQPPVVRQNDSVTVIYRKGPLEIRTTALAMENGAVGDAITLRNPDSMNTIRGTVTDAGLVEAHISTPRRQAR